MSTIVAGRFDTFADAERAARALYGHGLSVWDVSIFTVSPAEPTQQLPRPAGVLLAARVEPERCDTVANLIRTGGGRDLERAEGRWEHGRWADFDPLARPTPWATPAPEHRLSQLGDGALSPTGNEDPGSEIDQSIEQSTRGPEGGVGTGQRQEVGSSMPAGPDGAFVSPGDRPRAQAQAAGEPRQAGAPVQTTPTAGERHAGAAGQGPVAGGEADSGEAGSGKAAGDSGSQAAPRATGEHPADQQPREAWESAPSHRRPDEIDSSPELVRGHTTTPEPRDEKDTLRQMRRGEFPPGVGEGELRDPGSSTPGAPKVDNRS